MTTLENAAAVLRQFTGGATDISVTETHRLLGMPKSSVGRLLQHMRHAGFLDVVDVGPRYRLGSLIIELARYDRERHSLANLAEEVLAEICKATGHTGYVSALSGTDIVVLRSHAGTRPLQVVTPLGQRMPAAETAIGRALLAHLSESQIRKLYSTWRQPQSTNSPASLDQLLGVLEDVREFGHAVSFDEAVPGVGSTAMALIDRSRSEMLGVCVSYAASQVDADEKARLADVIEGVIRSLAEKTGQIQPVVGRQRRGSAEQKGGA